MNRSAASLVRVIAVAVCWLSQIAHAPMSQADEARGGLSGQLLYSGLTDGVWQIWRLDLASDTRAQLTFSPGDKRHPSWLDNDSIGFCTSNQGCYRLSRLDGKERPLLQELWPMRDLVWSPVGGRVAFAKFRTDIIDNANLWVADVAGPTRKLITHEAGIQQHPAWSPDGKRIAFSGGHGYGTYELYIVDADGSGLRRLTTNTTHEFSPAWSPDGKQLAYSADASGDYEIWVIGADGSRPRQLTQSPGLDATPTWSPDGAHIAFASNRSGAMELWVMDADGNNARRVERSESGACDPAWR